MPALPRNIYKTPHGFQFRIVVPEDLRPLIGKREIKKALGKDYTKAVSRGRILAVQVDRQLNEARHRLRASRTEQEAIDAYLATPVDKRLKPITHITQELVNGLKSLWLSGLEADLTWRHQGIEDEEYDDLQENITKMQKALADALARGRPEPFIPPVLQMLHVRGYDLMVSEAEERELVLGLLPAIQQGYDLLAQRQQGRLVEAPVPEHPVLPASWELGRMGSTSKPWQDLYDHWKADRQRNRRTEHETLVCVQHIQELFPHVTPENFSRAHVTDWLRHERDTRGNSPGTLEKKGTLVGALFSVAVKDERLEKNPFAKFDYKRFAAKSGMENPDEREPFTLEQLKTIFSSTGLLGVEKQVGGGGYYCRVWCSLMALYSGARIDEIGSLTVDDIFQAPVPYFRIRKGKTHSSVRDVPIHPKLIELGLMDYIEAIHAAGHYRLWPNLKSTSKLGDPSEVLGKWFNNYIHKTLKFPKTVVFHSFRHTFKDLCRDSGIPRDVHEALTGHAKKSVGDDYGRGYSIEFKHRALCQIDLKLAIPKPKAYTGKGAAVRG